MFSIQNKLSEVQYKICEAFKIMTTDNTWLWIKKEGQNDWVLLDTLESKLSDIETGENAAFMIEVKINWLWPWD